MPLVPLQVPGVIEVAVIGLIFLGLFVPVVLLVLLIRWFGGRRAPESEGSATVGVEDIDDEVAELKTAQDLAAED